MDFLGRFEKLVDSDNREKLQAFKNEVEIAIDAYAEITDYLKKQQFRWNKETEALCILRDMIQKKLKGENHE